MRILAIETSCDDTCVAVVEAKPRNGSAVPNFKILSNIVSSQTKIHQKYGGVVPSLAKREHQKNLVPVLIKALDEAWMSKISNSKFLISNKIPKPKIQTLRKILEREPELLEQFIKTIARIKKPTIDFIAVTHGPGLEPALWAGINFARALSYWWNIPLIGADHMEGHVAANFLPRKISREIINDQFSIIKFPAIVLAVSGGHTQLILVKDILKYKLLGETVDDAAGEAFDKVARMLGLGFPGGPEIAKLAEGGDPKAFDFPRPMLRTKDYNFSFSGLKTAVLYKLYGIAGSDPDSFGVRPHKIVEARPRQITLGIKKDVAASFQQAVIDVLIAKTIRAAKEYNAKTIMLAGGVAANKELRKQLGEKIKRLIKGNELKAISYKLPASKLATDNAAMIAVAAYFHRKEASLAKWKTLKANGNKKLPSL